MGREAKVRKLRRAITKLYHHAPKTTTQQAVTERDVQKAILPLVHKVRNRIWRRVGLGGR